MPRRKHHHVYVIELSKDVLLEPRFRKNKGARITSCRLDVTTVLIAVRAQTARARSRFDP
jgi:hypothetical protein